MDAQQVKRKSQEKEEKVDIGDKKYGRLVRMFKEGYVSICIYKNVYENKVFYDIVIYRKIKNNKDGSPIYKRGANLKPIDLKDLLVLLKEVDFFLKTLDKE